MVIGPYLIFPTQGAMEALEVGKPQLTRECLDIMRRVDSQYL
jgi:hypothetical protein